MKKSLVGLVTGLLIFGIAGVASAVTWNSNGHEYEIINSPSISWAAARTAAQAKGAGWDLATITSIEEQNFIANNLLPSSTGTLIEYYIGGQYKDGKWGWVTGEAFIFNYFGGGEPNYMDTEHFIAMDSRYNHPNWGWNNYTGGGADFVAGYVAEKTTATPVPAAVWLLGSGLVGLAGLKKRRSKK